MLPAHLIAENHAGVTGDRFAPPSLEIREGRYLLRFAQTAADIDAVLKLRFAVFNLELGEGLSASFLTGRDEDEFDQACHHLMVLTGDSEEVIGTYRLQTSEMAARGKGFYSAGEFDLAGLPQSVRADAIELGRACIAPDHRHTQVLYLLWKGLAAYLTHARKRFLFGCCSLTSQCAEEGWAVTKQLSQEGCLHKSFYVSPRPGFECLANLPDQDNLPSVSLPRLFRTYLRIGAKVCGPPALDRQFRTIDFFVILDINELNAFTRRMFFGK